MPTVAQAVSLGNGARPVRTNTVSKGYGIVDMYHRVYYANGAFIDTLDKNYSLIKR